MAGLLCGSSRGLGKGRIDDHVDGLEPLLFEITIAGYDRHSICFEHHDDSIRMCWLFCGSDQVASARRSCIP
jgi:hypothetical protein